MDGLRRVQINGVADAVAPAHCPLDAAGLAVAFSGGPDSTALLHALVNADHDSLVRALHVCHHLNADAGQWAEHCRTFCRRLGVAFECLDVRVQPDGEGIEAAARRARYSALEQALRPGEVLVLAQHADDQAETFLLQALRGAGVAGLAAMPERAAFARGWLWRPLLGLPRSTLHDYARAQALDWVDDPSNRDTRLDRGYLRQALWPVLTRRWPAAGKTLSRAARWCAEASALVDEVAVEDSAAVVDADNRIDVAGLTRLSDFRQGGVLRHWLGGAGHDTPDHRHIAEIRRLLTGREHAGPAVAWRDTEVRLFDGRLYAMRPLPPAPAHCWTAQWSLHEPLPLPAGCGRLWAFFDGEPAAAVEVRFRRGGERFVDRRGGGTRTLKTFLQEARVPPWLRQRLPLVFCGGRLVAIADYWLDPGLEGRLAVTALRLVWRPGE